MDVKVELNGDSAQSSLRHVADWLRTDIPGVAVEPLRLSPRPDEMGADATTILSILLGSNAVLELVKSLNTYWKTSRKKIDIDVVVKGKKIRVSGENLDEALVLSEVQKIAEN